MHPFRQYISRYATLTDAEWSAIEPELNQRVYEVGDTLLREGEICRRLYFLETGFLRYYVIGDAGDPYTKYFTESPYCFTSQRSFSQRIPATTPSRYWKRRLPGNSTVP